MVERDHRGLIPARAGNTRTHRPPGSSNGAHPRSRGEHRGYLLTSHHDMGSSPLARGTLAAPRRRPRYSGLIPARAGNTQLSPPVAPLNGAHPRSRGEHPFGFGCFVRSSGSSPLARGTPDGRRSASSCGGLIPARAGNTRLGVARRGSSWAHPRSRGEHDLRGGEKRV